MFSSILISNWKLQAKWVNPKKPCILKNTVCEVTQSVSMLKTILKYLMFISNLTLAFDSEEVCHHINGKNQWQGKWNSSEVFLNLEGELDLSKEPGMKQQCNTSFDENSGTHQGTYTFLINLSQFAHNSIYSQLKTKTYFVCFKMLNQKGSNFDSIFMKIANFVNWVEENANKLNVNNNPTTCGEYLLPIVLYFSVFVTFII